MTFTILSHCPHNGGFWKPLYDFVFFFFRNTNYFLTVPSFIILIYHTGVHFFLGVKCLKYHAWVQRKDLNFRPLGYEPSELTTATTLQYKKSQLNADSKNPQNI